MKFFTTIYLSLILFCVILCLLGPISAQADFIEIPNPLGDKSITEIIGAVTGLLKMIAIGVGIIMVVWSGIMIMTAAGSEEKVTKAKKTLTWTIIGVAIVVSVDFIVGFLLEILG